MVELRRWLAFSLSLLLHAGAIGLVLWVDIAFAPAVLPHYEVLVIPEKAPHDSKMIWYDFRKALPEVVPDRSFGPLPTPHGEKDPTQTLITVSPVPSSTRQLIRQPEQPKLLPLDVPAPNLVAVEVKLPPRTFVPPPVHQQTRPITPEAPATIEAPASIATPKMQTANALGAMTSLQKLPPKAFVPPVRSAAAGVAPHVDVPAAPLLDSQSSQVPGLQAVMIGLNPTAALPPPGSRPGQIARAPESGTPSSGASTGPNASIVPGLLSHGKPGDPPTPVPLPVPAAPNRGAPQEIALPGVNRTMSAPLRPSSRLIPAVVEARFALRNVYTLVIPAPSLPGYSGDWVLWFAEREPGTEPGTRISAPIPARRYSLIGGDSESQGLPATAVVQFAAIIDKAGHIGSAVVLRGSADPALRRRALEELGSWEFRPTLRNGQPIDADVVLEIPFRFQAPEQTPH